MSIRHAILGVLTHEPMHGYRIRGEVERRLAGGRYNSAQIYQGLRWLAERGLVVAESPSPGVSRDRRPFSITPKGASELERWLRAPLTPSRPLRDEVMVKLAFLGLRDVGRLVESLERLRRQHLRRLSGVQTRLQGVPGDDGVESLIAQLSGAALRFREEAELHWIDHCLERLGALLGADADAASTGEQPARQDEGNLRAKRRRS